ncbi:hypothetical protein E2C01_088760 [Portunus trituberculatus]|uniref:Uncharacterized protein n=1 Tax=Portunus trituberculatus TaxID=210409 RepID=A0A5B7JHD2_PORTR|nr:hypothetical protein [Portunus trituberculatus]
MNCSLARRSSRQLSAVSGPRLPLLRGVHALKGKQPLSPSAAPALSSLIAKDIEKRRKLA